MTMPTTTRPSDGVDGIQAGSRDDDGERRKDEEVEMEEGDAASRGQGEARENWTETVVDEQRRAVAVG